MNEGRPEDGSMSPKHVVLDHILRHEDIVCCGKTVIIKVQVLFQYNLIL
jgi:hypothetical protein